MLNVYPDNASTVMVIFIATFQNLDISYSIRDIKITLSFSSWFMQNNENCYILIAFYELTWT